PMLRYHTGVGEVYMNANSLPLWNGMALLPSAVLMLTPGLQQIDVFNFRGPDFLKFFVGFAIVVFFLAGAWRRYLIGRIPVPDAGPVDPASLDPYEVAYLSGKGVLAVNAALVQLSEKGQTSVSSKGEVKLLKAVTEAAPVHPLERAIARACGSLNGTPL